MDPIARGARPGQATATKRAGDAQHVSTAELGRVPNAPPRASDSCALNEHADRTRLQPQRAIDIEDEAWHTLWT